MHLAIRPADRDEVAALADLARRTYADAFGASMSAPDLAHHLAHRLSDEYFRGALDRDVILVAALAGRSVGFVQFGPAGREPGAVEIRRLYVDAGCRNRGIGGQLMAAALAHPTALGARRVYLDVWEDNRAAQRFYRRFGFAEVDAHPIELASGPSRGRDLVLARQKG